MKGSDEGLLAAVHRGWFDALGHRGQFLLFRVVVPVLARREGRLLQLPFIDVTVSTLACSTVETIGPSKHGLVENVSGSHLSLNNRTKT